MTVRNILFFKSGTLQYHSVSCRTLRGQDRKLLSVFLVVAPLLLNGVRIDDTRTDQSELLFRCRPTQETMLLRFGGCLMFWCMSDILGGCPIEQGPAVPSGRRFLPQVG